MNASDLAAFFNRFDWNGPLTLNAPVLGVVLLLLLVALVALWRRPRHNPAAEHAVDASHQFAARAPISDEQVALLRYLQAAFPDGAVLYRPRLGLFLSVRAGRERAEARQWLNARRVDFLLCAEDGKPLYAFEIDMLRERDDPQAQRLLAEKNHALKSAGIRLIRFKGALSSWPPPEVLRERVLSAARPLAPSTGFAESGFAPSGFAGSSSFQPSGFARSSGYAPSGHAPSQFGGPSSVMSLSDLARLQPANEDDPWSSVRKRS